MMFKPMLAATVTERAKLRFPLMASPKLDGIRCVVLDGKVLSKSLKPIRNKYIQEKLCGLPNLDGELIVGSAVGEGVINRTIRGVMSADGRPEFTYHVFDTLDNLRLPFRMRLAAALGDDWYSFIEVVPHTTVSNLDDLAKFEAEMLRAGYEGVMLRHPEAPYKMGRATPTEGSLWKLKQFTDGEILVTEVCEGVINSNEPTKDAIGATVRSTHQENMVPSNKVGTIIGVDMQTGQTLKVSPGKMTHTDRERYWADHSLILGKIVKYKSFEYGSIDAPRFATFQAFRDPTDM